MIHHTTVDHPRHVWYSVGMIQRHITPAIVAALADTPVVLVNGARQTGKSTLVQWIAANEHPARYLTLDEPGVLAAAHRDPTGFLRSLEGPVVLDEIQLAPEMFRNIKLEVDRNRQPGRFLLTGSANVLMLPRLSDSLAGRMEILTLWPFSQGEMEGIRETFIDAVFADSLGNGAVPALDRAALVDRILVGGYPEVIGRSSVARRKAWFDSYISTMIQRDVRDIADIEGRTQLPRLLELLAIQAMSLLNMSELSRSMGIPHTTLKRYLSLLEATFLIQTLPAWSGNVRKRLIRSPKMMLIDTALVAHLLAMDRKRLMEDSPVVGPLLESFVAQELRKQITWSSVRPKLFYYRTAAGREVDFVLEGAGGRLVGIEVKASATLDRRDFRGLDDLAQATGKRFHRGILLYTGSEVIPFARNLHALPVSALWYVGSEQVRE